MITQQAYKYAELSSLNQTESFIIFKFDRLHIWCPDKYHRYSSFGISYEIKKTVSNRLQFSTPRVGFEPTTLRLTAECSTAELSRTTFIIINTLHIFCKCFFHFLCTLKTTYKFKSSLHPFFLTLSYLLGYALDRLVTVSSMHYCTSTSALSTLSSSRGLTTCVGISHLEGGFTLRCLQRLSLPDLATLPCSWRNNRYTSGQSSPVLSY